MNSSQDFFQDDPWDGISGPCYPEGRRLYLNDERFWVSIDENHQLLFFIQDGGGGAVKPLENLAGLRVTIEEHGAGAYRLVCRLTTHEPNLIDKFRTVAKDIAYHCSGYNGSQLFVKTQERIKSWANFLRPSRRGLTHSEFVGLFGELYVLSEHMIPSLSSADAVRAWIGPEGKKQDFTFDDCAVEVKTTIAGDQNTIRVSSLDQLDPITDRLYLLRVVASPATDGSGVSLGELYERCLEKVKHDVIIEGLFLQKASSLYGKANESQIKEQFKIVNISLFEVGASFPRLTRSNVDPAILEAGYELAVSALSAFEVKKDLREVLTDG